MFFILSLAERLMENGLHNCPRSISEDVLLIVPDRFFIGLLFFFLLMMVLNCLLLEDAYQIITDSYVES